MTIEHSPQLQDGRISGRSIEAHTKFWQQDPNSEQEVDTQNRLSSYADVINGEPAKLTASYFLQLLNITIYFP
jgi:hypothetical protein